MVKLTISKELVVLENKLNWDYNIPRSLTYGFVKRDTINCSICENMEIAHYTAPFMSSGVPYDDIARLILLRFGMEIPEVVIGMHKDHIVCTYIPDGELDRRIMEDMQIIETDTTSPIDMNILMESTIRGLNARRLYLEKTGTYGKEWTDIIQQLKQWTEIKLKKTGELPDDDISLKDLIKLKDTTEPEEDDENVDRKESIVIKSTTKDKQ